MVHIIELVGQPKVEFAQQVTMNRGLQLKPADSEGRSDLRKKMCSLNEDDVAVVSTLNYGCGNLMATTIKQTALNGAISQDM